jgi:hypothetical protein
MRAIILTMLLTLATSLAISQDTPEQIIEKFFQDYQIEKPENALDMLYATMPWVERIQDDLDKIKLQFAGLQTLVGEYYGYGLITKKELANSFAIYSYLVKFDRQPVRFLFEFYKPKEKWGLYSFSYDDNIDDELAEAIKLYNIDLEK